MIPKPISARFRYYIKIGGFESMNKNDDAVIVRCCDSGDDFIWLTEKGENRLCNVLTGILILAISPIFAVMMLM